MTRRIMKFSVKLTSCFKLKIRRTAAERDRALIGNVGDRVHRTGADPFPASDAATAAAIEKALEKTFTRRVGQAGVDVWQALSDLHEVAIRRQWPERDTKALMWRALVPDLREDIVAAFPSFGLADVSDLVSLSTLEGAILRKTGTEAALEQMRTNLLMPDRVRQRTNEGVTQYVKRIL